MWFGFNDIKLSILIFLVFILENVIFRSLGFVVLFTVWILGFSLGGT